MQFSKGTTPSLSTLNTLQLDTIKFKESNYGVWFHITKKGIPILIYPYQLVKKNSKLKSSKSEESKLNFVRIISDQIFNLCVNLIHIIISPLTICIYFAYKHIIISISVPYVRTSEASATDSLCKHRMICIKECCRSTTIARS